MKSIDICPVCNSNKLGTLFEKILDYPGDDFENHLGDDTYFRNYITFKYILRTKIQQVFKYVICKKCGLIFSDPRCDEEDMEIKYTKIVEYDTSVIGEKSTSGYDNSINRAGRFYNILNMYFEFRGKNVLDVGGAEGRILQAAVESNDCYVIDYEKRKLVDGVKYLGRTLEDVRGKKFDVVSMCHILEHLVNPKEYLLQLRELLEEGGYLYVEVPMELRKGYRGFENYITHINVFSKATLEYLLVLTGFEIDMIETKHVPNNFGWEVVTFAIARRVKEVKDLPENCYMDSCGSMNRMWLKERVIGKLLSMKRMIMKRR